MLRRQPEPEEKRHVFWPDFALDAAIVMLIVVIVLALMVIFLPVPHESIARPMDTSYIPRPEWYFLFLFEMLKFFPGKLEVVGAIIVPALAVLVLLLLPFFDRSPTMRPLKRPLASGIGLFVTIAIVLITIKGIATTPPQMIASTTFIELGARIYNIQDCSNCHAINGVGGTIGPDLAGIRERRTLSGIHIYIENPRSINPDSVMPGYLGPLTHEEVEGISMYLMSLEKAPAPAETPTPKKEVPPTPPAPVTPPLVPHSLEGRSGCLACHQTGVGEAPKIPADHSGRSNDVCLSCHKTK